MFSRKSSITCIILAVILFVATLPAMAFAADATGVSSEAALKAALQNGGSYKLTSAIHITEQIVIPQGKTVVLDLAGQTITCATVSEGRHLYPIDNLGNLTIRDTVGGGVIEARGIYNGYNNGSTVSSASMTFEGGAIKAIDVNGGYALGNYGTLLMTGGSLYAYEDNPSDAAVAGKIDATALGNFGTATLEGGSIYSTTNFTYAIHTSSKLTVPVQSTLSVEGAHGALYVAGGIAEVAGGSFECTGISGNTDHSVFISSGSLNITGGTFTGDSDSGGSCVYAQGGSVEIADGSFSGSSGSDVSGNSNTTITGGTFEKLTKTSLVHVAEGAIITNGGKTYVNSANGPVEAVKYTMLEGSNTTLTVGSNISLRFRADGDFDKFVQVKVDGVLVDRNFYTAEEGSTIIILKEEFVSDLAACNHKIAVQFTDGEAVANFRVVGNDPVVPAVGGGSSAPKTGDDSALALWCAMMLLSAGVFAAMKHRSKVSNH